MYAHFYQLSEDPFNLTPDPKFHYVNESTREAMASILHGLKARKGFLTLIGEAGTGKTTLLKKIADEIEGETQVVFVFNPGVSFDELLEFICSELGVTADGRRLHMLERLNEYLLEQLTAGRNVVVMIDEAQTLSDRVLEELRLLSNLETSKEKILQILLSGQPELEEKLRRPGLRQLRQRVAVRATLRPMRASEIGPYIETRLRRAGAPRNDLFTKAALYKIWRASRGIPRVVNVICDNAMMIAFAEGKKRIGYNVVVEAVKDLEGKANRWQDFAQAAGAVMARRWVQAALASCLIVALLVPLGRWWQGRRDRQLARATSVAAVRQVRQAAAARQGGERRELAGVGAPLGQPEGSASHAEAAPHETAASPRSQGESRPLPAGPGVAPAVDAAAPTAGVEPASGQPVQGSGGSGASVAAPAATGLPAGVTGSGATSEDLAVSARSPSPVEDELVAATIRRAQLVARATAARLFDEHGRAISGAQAPGTRPAAPEIEVRPGGKNSGTVVPGAGELPASGEAPAAPGASGGEKPASLPASARSGSAGSQEGVSGSPIQGTREPGLRRQGSPGQARQDELAASAQAVALENRAGGSAGINPPASVLAARPAPDESSRSVRSGVGVGARTPGSVEVGAKPLPPGPPVPARPAEAERSTSVPPAQQARRLARAEPERHNKPVGNSVAPLESLARGTVETKAATRPGPSVPSPSDYAVMRNAVLGRLVQVSRGDTIWDIAIAHYGTAGPKTLARILASNPGITDPRHLEVGTRVFLPFVRADQMVESGERGFRLILASAPDAASLAVAQAWVMRMLPQLDLEIVPGRSGQEQLLVAEGIPSRDAARALAEALLEARAKVAADALGSPSAEVSSLAP
ncbi:MAG: AAA family ATPase [Candidatus Dadabacteria bacterium]|nr:MAG: AAA family ATPase [Candidatus Dadabacteria bacterium]